MKNTQQPREDDTTARLVEDGITIDTQAGAANAWVYMAYKEVPASVITRVLAYPNQRRRQTRG
ncbi:hypothetical protein HSX11_09020 [Oxalobacteraceae bacterium]|nr:hypothetical protein [Oxalobacteraceae bacterium]